MEPRAESYSTHPQTAVKLSACGFFMLEALGLYSLYQQEHAAVYEPTSQLGPRRQQVSGRLLE